MPIYEYFCTDCHHVFEALRKMSEADMQIPCPECYGLQVNRKITVFYAQSEGRSIAGNEVNCNACISRSCSSCGK